MKKKTKGILAFAFLGGIMLTSGVVIGIPGILPQQQVTITNTPQDRFVDADRPRFCGTPGTGSTPYVEEIEITRPCVQPLAITSDENGNVWFTQTNTGNLGLYEPETGEFSEFFNPSWPQTRSMMWGIARYEDQTLWYTDDTVRSIWRYGEDTGTYGRIDYGLNNSTMPHRIVPLASLLVVNDYTGGRVSFFGPTPGSNELGYWDLYSPFLSGITSEVAFDSEYSMWYTNWREGGDGLLVNFDTVSYYDAFDVPDNSTAPDVDPRDYVTTVELPAEGLAVNGVAVDLFDQIWLTDTGSSNFYRYSPASEEFVRYTTPPPRQAAYGNSTGAIIEPLSRPYFAETDDLGRIVFNEQTANRMAVFSPFDESITEYTIPSRNPHWSDCEEDDQACGIAQVLGFALDGGKIWFTEWVENNIGVIDTEVELPYAVSLDPQTVYIEGNATGTAMMEVTVGNMTGSGVALTMSSTAGLIGIDVETEDVEIPVNGTIQVPITVTTDNAEDGTYKVALGIADDDVGLASYLTIAVGQEMPTATIDPASIQQALSGLVTASGEPVTIDSITIGGGEDAEGDGADEGGAESPSEAESTEEGGEGTTPEAGSTDSP